MFCSAIGSFPSFLGILDLLIEIFEDSLTLISDSEIGGSSQAWVTASKTSTNKSML